MNRLYYGKSSFRRLATAAVAVGFQLVVGSVAAMAAPVFTLNPSALGIAGAGGQFTADNETLTDNATIVLTPSGGGATFTDRGTLSINQFQLGSSSVVASGLNSAYTLYYLYSGAGTQNTPNIVPGTLGAFTSLNYSFYAAPITGGVVTYSNTGAQPTGIGAPILLATGSLISGGVVGDTSGQPAASATLTFTAAATAAGFFVSPSPFYTQIFAGFQNLPTQVTTSGNIVTITGGGGSANYVTTPVPEPAGLAILGAGLLGLALLRRRKAG